MSERLLISELQREFEVVEPKARYRLHVPNVMTTFDLCRLLWRSEELSGELMVTCGYRGTDAPDGKTLTITRLNVSSSIARVRCAKDLQIKSRAQDVPWEALLEDLCQRVLKAERTARPVIVLRDVALQGDDERFVHVAGFRLPWRHSSIMFGDGGSLKSYLALYVAGLLAQEGHRVAIFDWELDAEDHRERFGRLFGTEMPDTLFYLRCDRPLIHEIDGIKEVVHDGRIEFGVADSISYAAHDALKNDDVAREYFMAWRPLGIGTLHLAHQNRSEGGDSKPFGSAFFFNSARAIWNLKATEDGAGNCTVGVFDRKPSLRRRQQPFALDVTFTDDRTIVRHTDIASVDEFAPQLTVLQRVRSMLKGGALTREQIAAELSDQKPDTLRRQLNRAIERGQLVRFPGPGGVEQIGLAERRAS